MSQRADRSYLLRLYLADIARFSLLAKEEELAIAGDPERALDAAHLNKLVESNLAFVVKIAAEHRGKGVPLEDLLGEGNLGLLEAARRFDRERGVKFITYAVWWIRKAILAALSDQTQQVRLPRYQIRKLTRIRETQERLASTLGRAAGRDEVAAKLGTLPSKIEASLAGGRPGISLDDPDGPNGRSIGSFLPDTRAVNPEESLLKAESGRLLGSALSALNVQERTVISKRFGLNGQSELTLKEIGESMGLTRERIRQIEVQAKERIRRIIEYRTTPHLLRNAGGRSGDGPPGARR